MRLRRHFERIAFCLLVAIAAITAVLLVRGTHPLVKPVVTPPTDTPRAVSVHAQVINEHVCDKNDYVMSCALPTASVREIVRGVDPTTQGIDFGWSCPVGSAQSFGAGYLSYDTSKDWSLSCINAFHAVHKSTVAVWEAGANDAQGGYSLGYSQAKRAVQELSALDAPRGQPFDMAIDCDCSGASLVSYFKGANSAEPGQINAYGGYYQLLYLSQQHLVGHLNWQTYAWSGGRWLPGSIAPLEQYLNGSSIDYDRCIAANCGQWPYATPKPPLPLCSRTECSQRFGSSRLSGGIRAGLVKSPGICPHGCDERQFFNWWNGAAKTSHAHRLWLRYRIQLIQQHLVMLIRSSSRTMNRKWQRYNRAKILEEIGFGAVRKSSYNAYAQSAKSAPICISVSTCAP